MSTNAEESMIPQQYQDSFKAHTNLEARAKELALAIKDDASYREASSFRIDIDKQLKNWAIVIKPAVQAAHEAHQKIKGVENMVEGPLDNALSILDPQIRRWRDEQENARRIEQERINRQLMKDEEDQRFAEAAELEKSGKKAEAQALMEEPIVAPEVVLPSTTKVDGIQDRTYWSAQIFDLKALCKAIGAGKAPIEAALGIKAIAGTVYFDNPMINGLARSMKDSMNAQWKTWGVRAVSRKDISGGGR